MSQWWICPADGQVVVDDASILGLDCSPIPADVRLLFWHGTYGEILRTQTGTDAKFSVRERFLDPTPYVPIFNRWIAASEFATPPGSLAQAKAVKIAMVESLFNFKRQTPISVSGLTYNASDASNMQLIGGFSGQSVINAINDIITQFNAVIATFNSNLSTYIIGPVDTNANRDTYNIGQLSSVTLPVQTSVPPEGDPTPAVESVTLPNLATSYERPGGVTLGPMPYLGMPGSGTGSGADAVNKISERTGSLQSSRNSLVTTINGLTTIAAVAAFNITSGW